MVKLGARIGGDTDEGGTLGLHSTHSMMGEGLFVQMHNHVAHLCKWHQPQQLCHCSALGEAHRDK